MDKSHKGLFFTISNEVIWLQESQISCIGQISFWQFFRNRLIGWIGHALLVQPSISAHRIFFFSFIYFLIILSDIKPLSVEAPHVLVIQIQIQAVCTVHIALPKQPII
jgi:hypothetical protein